LRIRIALTLGAFLLVGGAITGTALADVTPSSTPPAPTATPAPAPPAKIPPAPTAAQAPGQPSAVTPAPLPPTVAPSRGAAPAVPRAIPAGPTGDLHLPAITDGN
jgi:hypothetical protein